MKKALSLLVEIPSEDGCALIHGSLTWVGIGPRWPRTETEYMTKQMKGGDAALVEWIFDFSFPIFIRLTP